MTQRNGESLLDRTVSEETFAIVSPVLDPEEESEWLLSDGEEVFPVVIRDQEFLDAVQSGEVTFVAGSSILAELEVSQWLTQEGVRSEYRVKWVISITGELSLHRGTKAEARCLAAGNLQSAPPEDLRKLRNL